MTKKDPTSKKYELLPTKITESEFLSLGHGLCRSGGYLPFAIRTQAKTHSVLSLTMIDPEAQHRVVSIVKATNKSVTSIQNLF
jgi:hypothetical protein